VQAGPVAELKSGQFLLHFVDSAGNARSFDLSSVFAEGGRFLHMSEVAPFKYIDSSSRI
jgi:hypothetical protein